MPGADSATKIFTLPRRVWTSTTASFFLRLDDSTGKQDGIELLWLSTKPETIDWTRAPGK